jgi:hypothetical protein
MLADLNGINVAKHRSAMAMGALCSSLALAMLACTSEPAPTEAGAGPSFSRAGAEAYTAVDLGTLGGANSIAYSINPTGEVATAAILAWRGGV